MKTIVKNEPGPIPLLKQKAKNQNGTTGFSLKAIIVI